MKKFALLSMCVGTLIGCTSTPMNYSSTTKQISKPPIGSINIASLGDELLVQGAMTERLALFFADTQNLFRGLKVHAGYFPKAGEDDDYEYFKLSDEFGAGYVTDLLGGKPKKSGVILAIRKTDNAICFVNPYNSPVGCKTDVNIQKKNWETTNSNNFQQTLLYNGKVGDKINIAYREFSSNMARPAFNNNVEYDLSQSNQIGYKGALLEVIDANNQTIKYKVIKNFNTQ